MVKKCSKAGASIDTTARYSFRTSEALLSVCGGNTNRGALSFASITLNWTTAKSTCPPDSTEMFSRYCSMVSRSSWTCVRSSQSPAAFGETLKAPRKLPSRIAHIMKRISRGLFVTCIVSATTGGRSASARLTE